MRAKFSICSLLVSLAIFAICTHSQTSSPPRAGTGDLRKNGFVPDATTAVKIAEAVLVPVYGEKVLAERPFKARLDGDVWTIDGTLHCPDGKGGSTSTCLGGTAEVQLSKADGRILFMGHYK